MTNERFKELLEELDGNSVKTLAEKNARYSADSGDALHNFKNGAEILGGTPAQACWGYMTKHLVALRDKMERNDFSDREDFLEKCQDAINYIRFLWCIGNEEKVVTADQMKIVDEWRKELNKEADPIVLNIYEILSNRKIDSYLASTKPIIEDIHSFEFAVTYTSSVGEIKNVYPRDKYYYEIVL